MDRINLLSDIIRTSLKFDTALENGKFCDLQKYSDELKSKLQNLKLTQRDNDDNEIVEFCDKIYKVNTYTIGFIEKVKKNNKQSKQLNNSSKHNNTLIFFYAENCQPSANFVPEWNKIKTRVGSNVNAISINCSKSKHKEICNKFKVYEYPMIKFVTPTKVHDYYGEMNSVEILNEFLLT